MPSIFIYMFKKQNLENSKILIFGEFLKFMCSDKFWADFEHILQFWADFGMPK